MDNKHILTLMLLDAGMRIVISKASELESLAPALLALLS